jgi:hypothetical protein
MGLRARTHTHTHTHTHTKTEAQVAWKKEELLGQLLPGEDQKKTEIEADWKRLVNQFKGGHGGGVTLWGVC